MNQLIETASATTMPRNLNAIADFCEAAITHSRTFPDAMLAKRDQPIARELHVNDYALFLTGDEVRQLTGRKFRSAQINALRKMGVPFFQNATGRAMVARAAIEGRHTSFATPPAPSWTPAVLSAK